MRRRIHSPNQYRLVFARRLRAMRLHAQIGEQMAADVRMGM